MNNHVGVTQLTFYIVFHLVTHLMRFFHANILRHDQMKVNLTLTAHLAGTQLMKTGYLIATRNNNVADNLLFNIRQSDID